MTTGTRIKERRKQLGISAEQLADSLGVSATTIYRYEKGDIEKMPVDILEPIARLLATTPAWLMGWDDPETEKQPSAGGELSEAQKELIDFVSGLPDETCKAILTVLRGQSRPGGPGVR